MVENICLNLIEPSLDLSIIYSKEPIWFQLMPQQEQDNRYVAFLKQLNTALQNVAEKLIRANSDLIRLHKLNNALSCSIALLSLSAGILCGVFIKPEAISLVIALLASTLSITICLND